MRFTAAFVVLAACLLVSPFVGQGGLLALSAIVGVFDSVGYGTASQLFAIFPSSAGGLYFIGASLASIVSIVISYSTGFATVPSRSKMIVCFSLSSAVVLLSFAVTVYLVLGPSGRYYIALKDYDAPRDDRSDSNGHQSLVAASVDRVASTDKDIMITRDHEVVGGIEAEGGLEAEAELKRDTLKGATDVEVAQGKIASSADVPILQPNGAPSTDVPSSDKSLIELFMLTWPAQVALALTLFTSVLTGSLIGFVPSQRDTEEEKDTGFATLLLYVGMVSGLIGKQLNVTRRGYLIQNSMHLLYAAIARTLLSSLFLTYVLA